MSVVERLKHWWHSDPSVVPCPHCGCPIQAVRGNGGGIRAGMAKHLEVVHPELGGAA